MRTWRLFSIVVLWFVLCGHLLFFLKALFVRLSSFIAIIYLYVERIVILSIRAT